MAGNEITVPSDIIYRTSKLWVRKHLTYFRLYDTEKRGYFCKEEADAKLAELVARKLDESELLSFIELTKETWDVLFSDIAISSRKRTIVMWHDYVERQAQLTYEMPQSYEKRFRKLCSTFFDFGDKNKDGICTAEEFIRVATSVGISEHSSRIYAATSDVHSRSAVTKDEHFEYWRKYFYSTEFDCATPGMGLLDNAVIRVSDRSSIKWIVSVPEKIMSKMDELWVRKMLTFFRQYDLEGVGHVDRDGMMELGLKRAENKIAPNRKTEVVNVFSSFWDMFWKPAAKNDDQSTKVTWSSFLNSRFEAAENPATEEERLTCFHNKSFHMIDVNRDGVVQLEEYLLIASIRGLSCHQAVVSFETIDSNGDGTIDLTESLDAWRLFLYSKEWDAGALLYGTPINTRITSA